MNKLLLLSFVLLCVACGDSPNPANTPDKTLPVEVDSFQYDLVMISDSAIAPGEWPQGVPVAHYDLTVPLLTSGTSALRELIRDSLVLAWTGESHATGPVDWQAYIEKSKALYLAEFDEIGDDDRQYPSTYRRAESLVVEPVLNRPDLIVLAANHYAYFGGAHGMYYTAYYNFTDAPARSLGFDDLIAGDDTARKQLTELVNNHLDREFLYDPDDRVAVTENVAITKRGLRFCYPPYEIGPYAAGQIEVTVPYQELHAGGILTPEAEKIIEEL